MNETDTHTLQREQQFHDAWAANIRPKEIDVTAHFIGSTSPENRFIMQRLGDINGKAILDLGCGAGENAVYFALQGAHCTAADWSQEMVNTALLLAALHGVSIEGQQVNAHELPFPDGSFDCVYAANLLHHVDIERALREMHRVLKPGGAACFWDPLKHNPIINVYRRIASEVRTEDEHPLDISIVGFVRSLFSQVNYDTFWLATLWIFLRFYLIEKANPNKERYWKKIITEEPRLRDDYNRLERIDRLLKIIPGMKRYAWNIAVVARK